MAQNSKLKIFGIGGSTCTRRVLGTLEELEIPYELVKVDLVNRTDPDQEEHKQGAYLVRQPFGQIPVVEDIDGTRVFESRAIMRYLIRAYPQQGARLVPKDNQSYANVEAWMNAESENYNPPIASLVFEIYIKKFGKEPNPVVVAEQKAKLTVVLDVIEKHFADTKWQYIAGNHFTLADIPFQPCTEYLVSNTDAADLVLSRPLVAAWWKRISERPAWQRVKAMALTR